MSGRLGESRQVGRQASEAILTEVLTAIKPMDRISACGIAGAKRMKDCIPLTLVAGETFTATVMLQPPVKEIGREAMMVFIFAPGYGLCDLAI